MNEPVYRTALFIIIVTSLVVLSQILDFYTVQRGRAVPSRRLLFRRFLVDWVCVTTYTLLLLFLQRAIGGGA